MSNENEEDNHEVLKWLANLNADFILEKNATSNYNSLKEHIKTFNERVDLEEENGDISAVRIFKALTYDLYRLKDGFEGIMKEAK